MAITNRYATLAELKSRLDIHMADHDVNLEQMIESASRQIDGWTARTFYPETATRVVTAGCSTELVLDRDLITLTGISTDADGDRVYETVWSPTDWELAGPIPHQEVLITPYGRHTFPTGRNRVQVTGVWGFGNDVPAPIREATLLLASRLYKRKDAPFGIAGNAEHGELQTISAQDPDVKQLIQPYRRFGLVGV